MASQHSHTHHAGCDHDHGDKDKKEEEETEEKIDPKQVIIDKENEIATTLKEIDEGLKNMEKTNQYNVVLVEKEFSDLIAKLKIRRDTLIKQLHEIENDKKEILTKQVEQLKLYQNELKEEKSHDTEDIDTTIAQQDVSIVTKPEIILNIDNNKLSQVWSYHI